MKYKIRSLTGKEYTVESKQYRLKVLDTFSIEQVE